MGKRVVFLKQLESGLLLVTGPFKVNGVPLRRINQAYVIATSTKVCASSHSESSGSVLTPVGQVPVDGVNVSKFDDAYFAKIKAKKTKTADGFFATEEKKEPLSDARKADQKAVDSVLIAAIKKTEFLLPYLRSHFTLTNSDKPHELKF